MSGEDRTGGYFWGTGRRKTSTARVRLRPGQGAIVVNGRKADDYFHLVHHRQIFTGTE